MGIIFLRNFQASQKLHCLLLNQSMAKPRRVEYRVNHMDLFSSLVESLGGLWFRPSPESHPGNSKKPSDHEIKPNCGGETSVKEFCLVEEALLELSVDSVSLLDTGVEDVRKLYTLLT
jgi:hypothetical protein